MLIGHEKGHDTHSRIKHNFGMGKPEGYRKAIRLMEMGLTDGEEITLIGFAPLGDPIEFLVRSYRLSLRKAEAKRVTVAAKSTPSISAQP